MSEYLKAGAERVLGVDVSPQMIARAREKFSGEGRVEFIASDAVDLEPRDTFDAAVIYNAYPHFLKRELLVRKVAELLAPHGRFTIAHGAGRDQINGHHRHGVPGEVVCELRAAEEECDIWRDLFTIDAVIDTPEFYAFSGFLK